MKLRFLGTGTSTGNPEIGCRCEVCTSADPKDERYRASVLVETDGKHLLIDCGPDFRMQMLETFRHEPFFPLDGVLLTHEHYDHVGGLDDLRAFGRTEPVKLYAEAGVARAIRTRMAYVFKKHKYPGVPNLQIQTIGNRPFTVAGVSALPVRLMHGNLPILGYRMDRMAYLTDLKTIPEEEYAKLQDLDVLVINALRPQEHIAHETLADALRNIERIRPRRAYLTHVSHSFGLHEAVQKTLPENVFVAFDGLEVYV
ncbi:MAG: MBL fold metallo-hydrolase [Dysgonamonadaceae bacterium]|nr:MBL fold metallo-hydrolase [Dysgonamonadaceae bacterium]